MRNLRLICFAKRTTAPSILSAAILRCAARADDADSQPMEPEAPEYQRLDTMAEFAEQQSALLAALGSLPREQRETLLLHEETGLTIDEIARVTDVGLEAAKSRLRYAIRKLKQSPECAAGFGGAAAACVQEFAGHIDQWTRLTTGTVICAATASCRAGTAACTRSSRAAGFAKGALSAAGSRFA